MFYMNCVAGSKNFLEFSQAPPGVLYRLNLGRVARMWIAKDFRSLSNQSEGTFNAIHPYSLLLK